MKIGGNTTAIIKQAGNATYNSIGERVQEWTDVATLHGWLDLSAGEAGYKHDAKLQDTTHIFMCDYAAIDRKPDDKRMVINGAEYDVLLIDNPMEKNYQLEIYLKYLG